MQDGKYAQWRNLRPEIVLPVSLVASYAHSRTLLYTARDESDVDGVLPTRSRNTVVKFVIENRNEDVRASGFYAARRSNVGEKRTSNLIARRKDRMRVEEKKKREESRERCIHAPEKRIKGVTTSNVALTGNWTILFAIEVVMALVAWSRYTTVRHSTIETSGPPQEVRHTCSGVCVPIIRAPAPLQCVPSSTARTGSNHATDILPFVRGNVNRGEGKKK